MKLVYFLPYFLFPTKIPNSVNGSYWEIKIKMHFPLLPLGFSEGVFRNSLPSAVLTVSGRLWFWQV